MVHALFRDRMAYVGESPWHKLGKRVPQGTSSAEFIKAAGLDWDVECVPASGAKQIGTAQDGTARWNRYVIRRPPLAEGEVEPVEFAIVSSRYRPLQNRDAFGFFDPLLRGWADLEAAGALHDGEVVWVQVRVRDNIEIQHGDTIERFLLLRNRHDAKGGISVRFTPVRVVCQNTLRQAELNSDAFATVRHSKNMEERLAEVRHDALRKIVEAYSERIRSEFAAMIGCPLSAKVQDDLLTELYDKRPAKPRKGQISRRERIEQRLEKQPDVDPLAGKGTAWALYNAITWVEDQAAREEVDEEAGLNRMWFGSGAEKKAKAHEAIMRAVAAGTAKGNAATR
jgi:phage/plasmid-like protein (TIGR03299 family)